MKSERMKAVRDVQVFRRARQERSGRNQNRLVQDRFKIAYGDLPISDVIDYLAALRFIRGQKKAKALEAEKRMIAAKEQYLIDDNDEVKILRGEQEDPQDSKDQEDYEVEGMKDGKLAIDPLPRTDDGSLNMGAILSNKTFLQSYIHKNDLGLCDTDLIHCKALMTKSKSWREYQKGHQLNRPASKAKWSQALDKEFQGRILKEQFKLRVHKQSWGDAIDFKIDQMKLFLQDKLKKDKYGLGVTLS